MRSEIQQLEEAIAGTLSPIFGIRTKVEVEGDDTLDERASGSPGPSISMAQISKLSDAMVESPRFVQMVSGILASKSGGSDPGSDEIMEFQSTMRGFLNASLPVLFQDRGLKVPGAAAGKGRRGLKAIGSGKGVEEALMAMNDEPLSEDSLATSDNGSALLREELDSIL